MNDQSVFLLFRRGASLNSQNTAGGIIPPHDGHGPMHMAFAIPASDLYDWEQRLMQYGVTILSRVEWPSIYFNDHDNHLIELATLVLCKQNFHSFGCVKASGFVDRKSVHIDLILTDLRSANRESFHISPKCENFVYRVLGVWKIY